MIGGVSLLCFMIFKLTVELEMRDTTETNITQLYK